MLQRRVDLAGGSPAHHPLAFGGQNCRPDPPQGGSVSQVGLTFGERRRTGAAIPKPVTTAWIRSSYEIAAK
jgi:hypothetical protein